MGNYVELSVSQIWYTIWVIKLPNNESATNICIQIFKKYLHTDWWASVGIKISHIFVEKWGSEGVGHWNTLCVKKSEKCLFEGGMYITDKILISSLSEYLKFPFFSLAERAWYKLAKGDHWYFTHHPAGTDMCCGNQGELIDYLINWLIDWLIDWSIIIIHGNFCATLLRARVYCAPKRFTCASLLVRAWQDFQIAVSGQPFWFFIGIIIYVLKKILPNLLFQARDFRLKRITFWNK